MPERDERIVESVSVHPLAGQRVRACDYPDLEQIKKAYNETIPCIDEPAQRVSFGTSGHRGKAMDGSFTALHVGAVVQAICNLRQSFGATGPVFVGADTHYLSQLAYQTTLNVLAYNQIAACTDCEGDFVPTPSVSRAVLRYNENRSEKRGDGIIITPSHNPPDCGGIKYNPVSGGPADSTITKAVEKEANRLLETGYTLPEAETRQGESRIPYDYKGLYVEELSQVIDMESIARADLHILVNALGGSGMNYWHAVCEKYHIKADFINDSYDPRFTFMTYDADGKVRMDCSSPYVMAGVIKDGRSYDLVLANDPDYDRFGVVCGPEGMIGANAFLTACAHYLGTHRDFAKTGIGKTVVTTELLKVVAEELRADVYEVPVGFKYFADLLYEKKVFFAGEESAGASFTKRDGSVWTTDKDGIIMCLLAAEIKAVTGLSPLSYYEKVCKQLSRATYTKRCDTAVSKEEKIRIAALDKSDIGADKLGNATITDIETRSAYENLPIGGIKISTADGWIAARPSGTEDLYKLYSESYRSDEEAESLLQDGKVLIDEALRDKK